MRALSIDTSTYRGQIALWNAGTCVARGENLDPARHAEALLGLVDRAFATSGWSKSALDVVVCGIGPGSFTGVRVALATAKGIALALDRPIVGVSGLAAMASSAFASLRGRADVVAALLDARKGEVFWEAFGSDGKSLAGPGHLAIARVPEVLASITGQRMVAVGEIAGDVAGPDAIVHRSRDTDLPDAAEIARIGLEKLARTGSDDIALLEPVYLRPPDITLPGPK